MREQGARDDPIEPRVLDVNALVANWSAVPPGNARGILHQFTPMLGVSFTF